MRGIDYEHACRACGLEWLENYSLSAFEDNAEMQCPECTSYDTYRCIGSKGFRLLGGGWAESGYYGYRAYDDHKAQGKKVELYDNKQDLERDLKGERAVLEKRKLKYRHELEKKVFGKSSLNEDKAAAIIKKKVDGVKA